MYNSIKRYHQENDKELDNNRGALNVKLQTQILIAFGATKSRPETQTTPLSMFLYRKLERPFFITINQLRRKIDER